MIELIDINGKKYPFLFAMDVVWFLSGSGKIEFKGEGENTRLTADYNDLIELFLIANKSAIEYDGKGDEIDAVTLKNGIRKNAKLFIDLQNKLAQSDAIKMFEDLKDDKKKT